jgi:hypothetical protein
MRYYERSMVVLWLAWVAALVSPAAAADGLSAKDQRDLAEVAQAYFHGDSPLVLKTLSVMVGRLNDQQVALADKQLVQRELPPMGKLLSSARLAAVAQGYEKSLPNPSAREAILVLPAFQSELEAVFERVREEPIMADPLPVPDTIEGFDPLLWNAHVLENKLANTQRFSRYMVELVKRVPKAQLAKLTEEQKKPLEADYDHLLDEVKTQGRAVEEREIELRLRRLQRAREVLANPQLTREKWLAAGAWGEDAFLVDEFLKKLKAEKPLRPALQVTDLAKQVERLSSECGKLAGDLTLKVGLFNAGLHWWLRGRYGQGPEFYGLAKSQLAMRSPGGDFALTMPAVTPEPTDPSRGTPTTAVPQYDRRHHYWWAWEYRRVARSGVHQGGRTTTENVEGDARLKAGTFKNTSFW